ncbi:hypothetical protein A1O3_02471 [Capronia epimyces CBS 606.96]|uniref:MAGE domain-containing protein n=1 Tax=Capronia epimyces CBS 606.96 TaxID=1182542 RepID=W9Z4J1_9EURO|nr:uncharacterized protein A1O3_02471 [Capronia epimyces CBS 606.96]EXJ89404.1 hypothetical protein A1O3_02471 [Capronia epimyces CBS 606.96]
MPPLKRRAAAISRDASESESESEAPRTQTRTQAPPARRRRRSASSSSQASSASSTPSHSAGHVQTSTLIKKLVRLALSTEYSRSALRRSDISTKVFKESNAAGRGFKAVFEGAQQILTDTFGMQLVELPSREKTTLKDRRNLATQTKSSASTSSKSWILVSTLPTELKTNPAIVQPARAPSVETEASYTGLYSFILSLIYLNNNSLTEQKLERYLKRVNADTFTPFGSLDKLLQRMLREGYLDKRRDTSSGEEMIEYSPGPRGKVEVGLRGVTGLVRTVYGYGAVPLLKDQGRRDRHDADDDDEPAPRRTIVKIEEDELNARLSRSLGIKVAGDKALRPNQASDPSEGEDEDEDELAHESRATPTRAGPSRQRQRQGTRAGR